MVSYIKLWACISPSWLKTMTFLSAYIPYFMLILCDWYRFIKFLAFTAAFLAFDATGHSAKMVSSFFKVRRWRTFWYATVIPHINRQPVPHPTCLRIQVNRHCLWSWTDANSSCSLWTNVPPFRIFSILAYNLIALPFSTIEAPCGGVITHSSQVFIICTFLDVLDRNCNHHEFYETLLDCDII